MQDKVFRKTKELLNKFEKGFCIFGLWPRRNSTLYYKIYSYIMFATFFIIFAIESTLEAAFNENLSEAMFAALLAIADLCIMFRMVIFYQNKFEIDKLIADTEIFMDIKTYFLDNKDQYNAILQRVNSFIDFAYKMYYMFITTVLMMMIVPIFNKEKVLLIKIWLPFDWDWKTNDSVFWCMYTYTMACMALLALSIGQCLFVWYIMLNISLKFEILGYRLTNLRIQPGRDIHTEVIDCIRYHLQIKSEIKRFGHFFKNLFTFQIMTSAICLCAEAFVLASVEPETPFEYLLYVATLMYLTFEIFFILYYGNEITLNSGKLSMYLFQTKWLEHSLSTKKDIKILMEIFKCPMHLFVGFILLFPLNLATFTSILNTSYSLFNILRKY